MVPRLQVQGATKFGSIHTSKPTDTSIDLEIVLEMRTQLYQTTAFLAILTASGAVASATPPHLLSIRDDVEIIPAYVYVSSLEGSSEDSSLIGLSRRDLPLAFRGLSPRDALKELDSRQICPTGTSLCQDGCCPSGFSCVW